MDSIITDIRELQGLKIYNQYANDEVYFQFFTLFKQYFFDKYVKNAQTIFDVRLPSKVIDLNIDVDNLEAEQAMQYFLFYYSNVFGFYSPLGKASGKNLYDDNRDYDKGLKWDDMQGNGFIPITDYITLIRYFMDYSSGSWTYGWLSRLIISYVKTAKFIIEPKLDGCIVHAVLDGKGRLNILSNIFTNREIYGFTPLQRVKFNILDNDDELQDEIDRIYNENDVVWQDPPTEPILPPTEPETELPEVDIPQNDELNYISKYTYYYDSLKNNRMPVDNERVSWNNHIGFDCECSDVKDYLLSMKQPSLIKLNLINANKNDLLTEWLTEKGKIYDDIKTDRTLRDEAKEFLCNAYLNAYVNTESVLNLLQFVPIDSPNALTSKDETSADTSANSNVSVLGKNPNDYESLQDWTIGVRDGVDKETLNYKDRPELLAILLKFVEFLLLIDFKVEKEIINKRMQRINQCLALRYWGMYYGANENGSYLIYHTPIKAMRNELPNYFNPENFTNLHFYELVHLYLANKCEYNTNLDRQSLEALVKKYAYGDLNTTNLHYLQDDEILEVAKYLELYGLYMQVHRYGAAGYKSQLISMVKGLYPSTTNYKKLLDNITSKVESDFTHAKKYDIKALLNECNVFIQYLNDKLRIKNNEISLTSFLDNVGKASMYEYFVYLYDNREKGYYKLPHHDEIEINQFLTAQAKLKELLANFSDDELELTKPKDPNTPEIQLPNIETKHPDMLEYAWLKFDKIINVDSKRLDSMSETELNDTYKELQLAYNYFGAMYLLSVGAQTQEQTLQNLQTIANIANIQISSIDEFLEKYQEIEANFPTFPVDSNTLRQQLKQMLPQVQEVYNALKVSE
ncbi:hypothetical protein [Helicobacter bilis]|uniref:hypothetical protein n=1 Tax=Helicobacter bilis TaxID=37372 RepID=UPI0025A9A735|nr:hypothetical protein [Helicobacter bilis]